MKRKEKDKKKKKRGSIHFVDRIIREESGTMHTIPKDLAKQLGDVDGRMARLVPKALGAEQGPWLMNAKSLPNATVEGCRWRQKGEQQGRKGGLPK